MTVTAKRFRTEIDDKNVIRIWDLENPNENNAPFLLQDVHPDGSAWESKEAAQAWLDNYLSELIDAMNKANS